MVKTHLAELNLQLALLNTQVGLLTTSELLKATRIQSLLPDRWNADIHPCIGDQTSLLS